MNNYIGIDISLNSTAVYIESLNRTSILSFTNKKDNNIYIKELNRNGVEFFFNSYDKLSEYSKNEIIKIKNYDIISDSIVSEIYERVNIDYKSHFMIEGYSFSKKTSSLLDIVALSTLVKAKIINKFKDSDVNIISPSSLKLEACKMSYEPINIGKKKPKYVYKNNEGISGGSFKKPQMYMAILEGNIDTPIYNMLNDYKYLTERAKIPNPIEDIIDSIFACKVLKKSLN